MPNLELHCLTLSHVSTRLKYLAICFESCGSKIQHLTLDETSLSGDKDLEALCEYLHYLELHSCVLNLLNFGGRGLRFGKVNKMEAMPSIEGAVAASNIGGSQFQLALSVDEGDDIPSRLNEIPWKCDLGLAWHRHV